MSKMKEILKGRKGITLIALVITIIVLLILAGVSIAVLTGDSNILNKAEQAKEKSEESQVEEKDRLDSQENYMNVKVGSNTEFVDSLGNIVKIPAGFKVINPNDNVEDGIIIEDISYKNTKGSQFVWIPVGKEIKKKDGKTFDISLNRYSFDENGIPTEQNSNIINEFHQELEKTPYFNTVAKNIKEFKTSVENNGGYYISRYEARDKITDTERTSTTDDNNQIVCTNSNYIYNFVAQSQAATLSQKMYSNTSFESDLVNSYAWDTAIVFIQKCSKNSRYSIQNSSNTEKLAPKGTTSDVVCNIYDMASNCFEWTTETSHSPHRECTAVGGYYGNEWYKTNMRRSNDCEYNFDFQSFRPILYL